MSEINWESIYYLLDEIAEWQEDDIGHCRDCAEELIVHIPSLIKQIQKLAKEKSELEKENKSLKLQLELKSASYGSLGSAIDWTKIRTQNAPGMHSILPFQTYEPKFTPTPKHSDFYDSTVWSNSTMRDSL